MGKAAFGRWAKRFGMAAYCIIGDLYMWGYGIEIGWGAVPNPPEGGAWFRHSWRWLWMTHEEWLDFGWVALSPVRPLWRRTDERFRSPGYRSKHWTGRDRELAGFELVWGNGFQRRYRIWRFEHGRN